MTSPEIVDASEVPTRVVPIAVAIVGSALGWLLVIYLLFWRPTSVLDDVEKNLGECSEAGRSQCVGSSGARSLGLAGWLPWTRDRADAIVDRRDFLAAYTRMNHASNTASARDAETMIAIWHRESARRTLPDPFMLLNRIGAHALMLAHTDKVVGVDQRGYAVIAALVLGDLKALARIAQLPADAGSANTAPMLFRVPSWSYELRRGALLCLLGRREEGIAALALADRIGSGSFSYPWKQATVGRVACGKVGTLALSASRLREWELASLGLGGADGLTARWLVRRRLTSLSSAGEAANLPLVAQAVLDGQVDPRAVLATMFRQRATSAATKKLDDAMKKLRAYFGGTRFVNDPRRWVKAADLVGAMATKVAPLEEPTYGRARIPVDVRARPAEHLRFVAGLIRFVAATEFEVMGQRERAQTAFAKALGEVGPKHVPGLIARTGNPYLGGAEALRLVGDKNANFAGDLAARLHLTAALYLETRGKLDDALGHANKAQVLAKDEQLDKRIAWVVVALSLRAGKHKDLRGEAYHLYTWVGSLDGKTAARLSDVDWPQLPALMYVLRTAAGASLDRLVGGVNLPSPIHRYQRARAEAARWSGDKAAAKMWNARALRLEALLGNYRSLVLARIVGL